MNFEVGGRRFYAMVSPDGQGALVSSGIYFHYSKKPTLKCIIPLQTKMKIVNGQVLIGITISANKTHNQSEYYY